MVRSHALSIYSFQLFAIDGKVPRFTILFFFASQRVLPRIPPVFHRGLPRGILFCTSCLFRHLPCTLQRVKSVLVRFHPVLRVTLVSHFFASRAQCTRSTSAIFQASAGVCFALSTPQNDVITLCVPLYVYAPHIQTTRLLCTVQCTVPCTVHSSRQTTRLSGS